MIIPLKNKTQLTSERQSTSKSCWVYKRIHESILRSQGHLFRDGQWTGSEDDFHVYREKELPGMGPRFNARVPSFLTEPFFDDYTPVVAPWNLCVCRSWDQSAYYGSLENHKLGPVEEPDFTDHTLNLNAQGTNFIVRNRPGNPAIELGVFVSELRDYPTYPSFLMGKTKFFQGLGDAYLNVEFGWKPFVNDLNRFYAFQRSYHAKLNQLIMNNGMNIRRRSKVTTDTVPDDIVSGTIPYPWPPLGDESIGGVDLLNEFFVGGPNGLTDSVLLQGSGTCKYKYQKFTKTSTWECGTFRYYTPDIGSEQWTARAIGALFGVNPTPSAIYNSWPWSWLIDWWTNAGQIMSNLSTNAVDNETLTNSFAMKTIDVEWRLTVNSQWEEISNGEPGSFFYFFCPAGSGEAVYSRFEINKLRHQASPYGFGIPSTSFSARQWAILAALGVTRLR